MNATFTKHNDPGHGWLEVQASDLSELGASAADFSPYSYRKGSRFFLEEDCDMSKFFTLFKNKFGNYPTYVVDEHNGDFPVDYNLFSIHS
jgi:hypothetical protein